MKKIITILSVSFLAFTFAASVSAAPNPADLVGWWEMDGNAEDSSYSGFNGTIEGDTTFVIDGVHYAASFDGNGDYIWVANATELNFTNALTVEGWVKLNSYGSGNQATIAGKWDDLSGNYREYLLTVNASGQASFYISSTGTDYPKAMWSTSLSTGVWYHLAGTYDGSNIKLYVDGDLKATAPFTADLAINTEQLLIGANDGYGGTARKFTDGYIDDVRIWKAALTGTDLMMSTQDLYNLLYDKDGDGYFSNVDDCDDTNPAINPGATEICNNVDDNCDGTTDEHSCNWFCVPTVTDTERVATVALGTNRWSWTGGTDFITTKPKGTATGWNKAYTLEQTNYCSCSQILAKLQEYDLALYGNMEGHVKYGCSISVMNEFIRLIKPGADIMTGQWLLSVNGGAYMHDMFILTQNPDGTLTGNGGYPAGSGPTYPYPYNWILIGQLTGNAITLTITYQSAYQAIITGTVDATWNYMSGDAGTGGVVNWSAVRIP